MFAFVFVIKSLLVCYCVYSLPLNTSLLKRLFTETKNLKSPTDINMTNPEERIKWFSRSVYSGWVRSVVSDAKHLFLRNTLHHSTGIGLCYKSHKENMGLQKVGWKYDNDIISLSGYLNLCVCVCVCVCVFVCMFVYMWLCEWFSIYVIIFGCKCI